jgi:hypothetical protein
MEAISIPRDRFRLNKGVEGPREDITASLDRKPEIAAARKGPNQLSAAGGWLTAEG